MIYLKKFETQAAYNAAESSLILPNVSLTVDNNTVHYNPYDPYNGYEYIDLSLPSGTKWAKMNVGASSETDIGGYYQYGKGIAQFAQTSGDSSYEGEENPLAASADTASLIMGGGWHMPTSAQCQELIDNTTVTWENNFNNTVVNGVKYEALNGNYIFIPAAGNCYPYYPIPTEPKTANIWTCTPNDKNTSYYLNMMHYEDFVYRVTSANRQYGNSIRGVVG